MDIICIANGKGGVGKSTTCANLAASFTKLKKRVLLIDLDDNESLTNYYKIDLNATKDPITITDILTKPNHFFISDAVINLGENLDLVPVIGKDMIAFTDVFKRDESKVFNLKTALSLTKNDYDIVIIDTPGHRESIYTDMAAAACTSIIVPLKPSDNDIVPTVNFLDRIEYVLDKYNPDFDHSKFKFLFTMITTRKTKQSQIMNQIFSGETQDKVLKSKIRHSIGFESSSIGGKSLVELDSKHNGSKDYINLAKECLQWI